eukprot:SAG11_NODE_6103_length_1388_cov_1.131109_1_plen_78_part_10
MYYKKKAEAAVATSKVSIMPTAEEMDDLSAACTRLWNLDENFLECKRFSIFVLVVYHLGACLVTSTPSLPPSLPPSPL